MTSVPADRPILMSSQRFLDHVRDGYDAGKRFCFILGAGASFTSGIPLGTTLIGEWRDYLLKRGKDYIEESARECGMDYASVSRLFSPDYKTDSADYFTFHDLRFAGMPMHAYAYLQRLMMKAEPSFGYYALAVLLEHTHNKLVITTNFDSLVEEALSLYHSDRRALVIGHERLAPFMRDTTNTDRPVIAKVHRDLLFHPMNNEDETSRLDERWVEPLRDALSRYIPIVVGYAGGDNSLMDFLADEDPNTLDTVYWCSLSKSEGGESGRITDFLRKRRHGYLVSIKGFDQILYLLLDTLMGGKQYDTPDVRIKKYTQSRADGYRRQRDRISNEVAGKQAAGGAVDQIKDESAPLPCVDAIDGAHAPSPAKTEHTDTTLQTLDKLTSSGSDDEAVSNEALRAFHNSALAYAQGRLEDALAFDDEAVRLEPKSALYHNSRGTTLNALGRYPEALEEFDEAVRLEPHEALYHHSRGVVLKAMNRYEEALEELDMAVYLSPNDALMHAYRGVVLDAMGQHGDALQEKEKAVQLEPSDALYHTYLAAALCTADRYEEALAEIDESIKLEPDDAKCHSYRAIILRKLGREDDAREAENRARELGAADRE